MVKDMFGTEIKVGDTAVTAVHTLCIKSLVLSKVMMVEDNKIWLSKNDWNDPRRVCIIKGATSCIECQLILDKNPNFCYQCGRATT